MARPISTSLFEPVSCVFSINTEDSVGAWETVQILISWLLKKPADLDLHCFLNRIYPGSAGQGLIEGKW